MNLINILIDEIIEFICLTALKEAINGNLKGTS
jgi:hypothetical protein